MSRQDINQEQLGSTSRSPIQPSNGGQHLIFLSHSGHDKPFVKKLYDALRDAGHNPFFDTHCLPAGEAFPPHIFENARRCRLGVIVLSPHFLTSRWPMMELHSMHTSPSALTILPLFFKLSPNDVKLHFPKWRDAWQTLQKQFPSRVNLIEWEDAAKNLSVLNGVVYKPDKSEDFFIQEVVDDICSVVRPPPRYMVSHLTGCERLTHGVETLFQEIPSSHFEAQAIGLHGIGGLGKTTICKLMVNHYAGVYAGRCALIEFPTSDYIPEAHILNQCVKALQQLTNICKGHISCVDDLDQCLQLLNDRVKGLDVFIAIDNIWEKYLWFAQRILDVGFSQRSKVLATSRSGPVLTRLLKDSRSVRPLPSLNREEAHQVFFRSFNRNHVGDLRLEQSDVDGMSSFFCFDYQYHPLAINALGMFLGSRDRQAWPATLDEMHRFFQHNDDLVIINRVIRINYDSIPNIRREMFLDLAVIYIPMKHHISFSLWSVGEDGFDPCLLVWLAALYKGRMEEWEIRNTLIQLASDGLLEFDIRDYGCKEVRVHDLYTDLAIQEGAANGKVAVYRGILSDKDIKSCAEVARIVERQMNILRTQPLPNLQLLMTTDSDCRGWRLELIPEVRILKVWNDALESEQMDCCFVFCCWKKKDLMGWENIPHLSWLELRGVTCEDISELSGLRVLKLKSCSLMSCCMELCLSRLVSLQVLEIRRVEDIQEITGLDTLINLKSVTLAHMPYLREVGNFSGQLTQLQFLKFKDCDWLEEVRGVGLLPNIESLRCARNWLREEPLIFSQALQYLALHNVREAQSKFRDMPALFFLLLEFQGGSVVEIHGLPRLEHLKLHGEVKEIATLSQLPSLEYISIFSCNGLEEIEWSSFHGLSNLKEIEICFCDDLQIVKGDPSGISCTLPHLVIENCEKLEEVAGLDLFTSKSWSR